MNIPNLLTMFRFALIPSFCYFFTQPDGNGRIIGTVLFAAAGLTDVLDGHIARKYKKTTEIGKIIDPLADKLMQISAFVCMYIMRLIPFWVLPVLFFKEALMIAGSAKMLFEGKKVPGARWYGKASTVALFLSVVLIMGFKDIPYYVSSIVLTAALSLSIIAFLAYMQLYFNLNKEGNE